MGKAKITQHPNRSKSKIREHANDSFSKKKKEKWLKLLLKLIKLDENIKFERIAHATNWNAFSRIKCFFSSFFKSISRRANGMFFFPVVELNIHWICNRRSNEEKEKRRRFLNKIVVKLVKRLKAADCFICRWNWHGMIDTVYTVIFITCEPCERAIQIKYLLFTVSLCAKLDFVMRSQCLP